MKGHHVFKSESRPGDVFICAREPGNPHSPDVIIVKLHDTVFARLYAPPPFCIIVQRKRRRGGGGGALTPGAYAPPPNAGFQVAVSLVCYYAVHAESRACHKIIKDTARLPAKLVTDVRRRRLEVEGKGLVVLNCFYIFRGKTSHLENLIAIFLSTS